MSNYALQVSPAEVSRYQLMAAVAERTESDLWGSWLVSHRARG